MTTKVFEPATVRTEGGERRIPFAWISAAALAIASIWSALIIQGVTQGSAPAPAPAASPDVVLRGQWQWFATTLTQERLVTGIAIVGFAMLILATWSIRERLGSSRQDVTAGAVLVSLGSALWIVGNILELGGHRAVGLMAMHDNPIETTNSIAFAIDMIDDAFELVAFVMLGVGMLGFARAAWRTVGLSDAWGRYTAAFAVALIALGVAHGKDSTDTADLLLLIVGAFLAPAWLLWADRMEANGA